MSISSLFNFARRPFAPPPADGNMTIVQPQRVLSRVLSFTGKTIDDVVNDPIAQRQVLGYFKLHKWVERETEIGDLERQWNHLLPARSLGYEQAKPSVDHLLQLVEH